MNAITLNRPHLLVVDDDHELRELLDEFLTLSGFVVFDADSGVSMRHHLKQSRPDLIILDQKMPGETGLELLQWLNTQDNAPPVMILSAQGNVSERIAGLEIGAQDYLAKPFEPRELLARINIILKRTQKQPEQFNFGPFTFFFNSHKLFNNNKPIELTSAESALLSVFCLHPDEILSRDQLMQQLKGMDAMPFDRSIDVRVTRLRKKIEREPNTPEFLLTVWGKGYKLISHTK
ncbi:MAG: response regulator [bacterium]